MKTKEEIDKMISYLRNWKIEGNFPQECEDALITLLWIIDDKESGGSLIDDLGF